MDMKVKGYPDLVRRGAAIINTNRDEYRRAQARAQKVKRDRVLEQRVDALEDKLDQILSILKGVPS